MRAAMYLATLLAITGCKTGDGRSSANGLEITSEGAEPRRVLKYAPAKGTKAVIEVATDMTMTAGAQGGAIPTLVVTYDLEVEDVSPAGAKIRMSVLDTGARDKADSQMPAAAAANPLLALKGAVVTGTLTTDGRLRDAHLELGEKKPPDDEQQALDAVVSAFENNMMPLPDVAVGVGATWKRSQPFTQGGMKLSASSTVVLTKLEGDTASFTTSSTLTGADQTVNMAGVPIHVAKINGTGETHATIDLVKVTTAGDSTLTFNAEMSTQDEKTPMSATTKIVFTPR